MKSVENSFGKFGYSQKIPLLTNTTLRFNGIGEHAYETFYFRFPPMKTDYHIVENGYAFNFCKTARQPYDVAVCECLLILKAHLKDDMKLESDGFSSTEPAFNSLWSKAIENVTSLGYEVKTKISRQKDTPYFDCQITEVIIK